MARSRVTTRRSFARPIVWAGLSVLIAGVAVQTTRSGIDILALLVAGFVLLLIERTLGDWVAETLGPVPATVLFAAVAVLGVAYVNTDGGRARARQLFAAANAQGYHTVYFSADGANVRRNSSSGEAMDAVPDALKGPVNGRPPVAASGASSPEAPRAATGPTSKVGRAAETSPGAASSDAAPSQSATERPARGVRISRLRVSPEVGVIGHAISFRVDVSSDVPGILPAVDFSVDGHPLASVTPAADGIASTQWKTMVPGQYVVRARLSRDSLGAGVSATLNVLPRQRHAPTW